MTGLRRAFWLRRRGGGRLAADFVGWLWQSGGILLLGAVAAGMTAFPAETGIFLKPVSGAVRLVLGTGLRGIETVKSVSRLSALSLRDTSVLAEDTERLKQEVAGFAQRTVLREEELQELIRLRSQLRLSGRLPYESFGARVIGADPGSSFSSLLLDAGTEQGVVPGQAVVAPAGAVGRIIRATPGSSVALWLCDPRSRIAAFVQRSRVHGVLVGKGRTCELKYLSVGDDVKVGDSVLTAGRGSAFPKGVMIGVVKEVHREGLLLAAEVALTVEVSSLEEVLVVTKKPKTPAR